MPKGILAYAVFVVFGLAAVSPAVPDPKADPVVPKLGLKPEPAGKLKVKAAWRAGTPPASPDKVDNFTGWKFNLGRNDEFGTCGPTGGANHKQMHDKKLFGKDTFVPFDQIADLYRRSGNPNFNPNIPGGVQDDGVVMSNLLSAMGDGAFGDRALAYVSLADISDASVYAAINEFGGVLFAVNLQLAQQSQTNQGFWDYRRSGVWGGHAILAGKYDKSLGRVNVVTWEKDVWTTAQFRRFQLSEVWVPIWESGWKAGKYFAAGLDTAAIARDWEAIGGKPLPVPGPVVPPVDPPVDPPAKGFTGEKQSALVFTTKYVTGLPVNSYSTRLVQFPDVQTEVGAELLKAFPRTEKIGNVVVSELRDKIAAAVLKP